MTNNDSDANQRNDSIDHTDPEVLRELYHERGLSTVEIADLPSVSVQNAATIRHHMVKNDIERRSTGENKRVPYATYCMESSGHYSWTSRDPDGKQRGVKVHRLIAIAEHGVDAVVGNHVHHKNGIPWDNRPSNLEIKTPEKHHSDHMEGESHPRSKLTDSEAKEILSRIKQGEQQKKLASEFGVSSATVSHIKHGKGWSHITDTD